jgi:hypothetical protein
MPRFVGRPFVVEAHQWWGSSATMPLDFAREASRRRADRGSWIVRDGNGTFSHLPQVAFELAFAPVSQAALSPAVADFLMPKRDRPPRNVSPSLITGEARPATSEVSP